MDALSLGLSRLLLSSMLCLSGLVLMIPPFLPFCAGMERDGKKKQSRFELVETARHFAQNPTVPKP